MVKSRTTMQKFVVMLSHPSQQKLVVVDEAFPMPLPPSRSHYHMTMLRVGGTYMLFGRPTLLDFDSIFNLTSFSEAYRSCSFKER